MRDAELSTEVRCSAPSATTQPEAGLADAGGQHPRARLEPEASVCAVTEVEAVTRWFGSP